MEQCIKSRKKKRFGTRGCVLEETIGDLAGPRSAARWQVCKEGVQIFRRDIATKNVRRRLVGQGGVPPVKLVGPQYRFKFREGWEVEGSHRVV